MLFRSSGYDNRISPRSIFFVDAMMKVNPRVILSPALYYTKQASSSEFVAGLHLNYSITGNSDQQLILGMYFRPSDAFVPTVGYQWGNFKFTFSYDATNSPLKYFNTNRGATEMAMQYDGIYEVLYGNRRQSFCPSF